MAAAYQRMMGQVAGRLPLLVTAFAKILATSLVLGLTGSNLVPRADAKQVNVNVTEANFSRVGETQLRKQFESSTVASFTQIHNHIWINGSFSTNKPKRKSTIAAVADLMILASAGSLLILGIVVCWNTHEE